MAEALVAVLIGVMLLFCSCSLYISCKKCSNCCGMFKKEDLIEILQNIPEDARIYISVDKG